MQHSIGAWGDVLAWVAVLAVLVALARAIVRIEGRFRAARPVKTAAEAAVVAEVPEAAEAAGRLRPAREWDLVVRRANRDLERRAALAALQANTALKIAAAEHAYNRLVLDCAKLCTIAAAPTVVSARRRANSPERPLRAPGTKAERRPLAA